MIPTIVLQQVSDLDEHLPSPLTTAFSVLSSPNISTVNRAESIFFECETYLTGRDDKPGAGSDLFRVPAESTTYLAGALLRIGAFNLNLRLDDRIYGARQYPSASD